MNSSEEVFQINSALIHCSKLKTQLHSTLMHIRRLNSRYNKTDYMDVVRNLENYRKSSSLTSSSPYPKIVRQHDHSLTDESNTSNTSNTSNDSIQCSTPVKPRRRRRPNQIRRLALNNALSSTPNRSKSKWNDTFDSDCDLGDDDTPRRSMRDVKTNNNTISVRTIKVQRNLESIITQLQVMQRSQKKRELHEMEQSLFQNCCNSSTPSPGLLGHNACCSINSSFESFVTAHGSNDSLNHSIYHTPNKFKRIDEDQKTLDRVQRFYATPLQRMHKRLIHLNASLVTTC